MNNIKVFVLMAGMTALFVAIGGAIGGQGGMVMALVFAGLMNFVMYFASSKMVLRDVRRAGRHRARSAGALRDGRPAAPARRAADADGRDCAARAAERVRDRTKSGERRRVRDGGHHAAGVTRRARGRDRARARAHQEPRHAAADDCGDDGGARSATSRISACSAGGRDDEDSNPMAGSR